LLVEICDQPQIFWEGMSIDSATVIGKGVFKVWITQ